MTLLKSWSIRFFSGVDTILRHWKQSNVWVHSYVKLGPTNLNGPKWSPEHSWWTHLFVWHFFIYTSALGLSKSPSAAATIRHFNRCSGRRRMDTELVLIGCLLILPSQNMICPGQQCSQTCCGCLSWTSPQKAIWGPFLGQRAWRHFLSETQGASGTGKH